MTATEPIAQEYIGAPEGCQTTRRWPDIAGALLIVAMCFAIYWPAMRGEFLWDDDRHVSENVELRSAAGLWRIWTVLGATPQYYPLTHTLFWTEYHLWGANVLGYHIVSVALHAIAAILLRQLLRILKVPGAFLAACIFAVHPIQAESVAWISEQKNLLSTAFAIGSLIAYLRSPRIWWLALLLFALAMLSKTVACSVPAAILVIVWWKNGRLAWRDVWPLIPFFVIGLGLSIVTGYLEYTHIRAVGPDWDLSPIQRLLIASRALWFYAAKLLWPANLNFSYPRWNLGATDYLFLLGGVFVAGTVWMLRHRLGRGVVAAVLIFGGVLVPALGFVNTYPMKYSFVADHFQYAAGMALIAAIVAALSRAKIPLIVFVAILCVLSWRQAHIYRGPETLWRDVIAKNSNSWMARNNLGAILAQQAADENAAGNREASIAKLELAIEQFKIVEQLRPQHEIAPFNYADALLRLGEFEESIDQYRKGIAVSRSSNSISRAYDRIGQMLEALNAPIQADTEYRCAIAADPKFADAHFRLARLLDRRKRPAAAIREFEIYVQLRPDDVRARTNLGMLYGVAGRFDEAANAFSAALEKDPEFAPAKKGLAISLEMKRRAASTRKAR